MVCMGNTCRSPIAQAIFQDEIKRRKLEDNWFVDSAATRSYHIGKPPNHLATEVLQMNNCYYEDHFARQLNVQDYTSFDFILGMDEWNVRDIKIMSPHRFSAKIELITNYDPLDHGGIYDPYCDRTHEGFQSCYDRCKRIVNSFFEIHQGTSHQGT